MVINVDLLLQAMDAQRTERGMSWRQVAGEIKVSAALFTRLRHGPFGPDLESYVRCCRWLGAQLETFLLDRWRKPESPSGGSLDSDLAELLARHGVPPSDRGVVMAMVRAYLRSRDYYSSSVDQAAIRKFHTGRTAD